jgi:hypothetical protein
MQGAQKLKSEAHIRVRRNDQVDAQSRETRDRWTFCEAIKVCTRSARSLFPNKTTSFETHLLFHRPN